MKLETAEPKKKIGVMLMKCLQCASERIVKNVRVVDRGYKNVKYDLKLEVDEKPNAISTNLSR